MLFAEWGKAKLRLNSQYDRSNVTRRKHVRKLDEILSKENPGFSSVECQCDLGQKQARQLRLLQDSN